jgi:replicative DNA helicase
MNTEQAVIASVIIDSSLMDEIELRPDDFNEPFFANVWRQMLQMRDDRQPIDLITVADAFPALESQRELSQGQPLPSTHSRCQKPRL